MICFWLCYRIRVINMNSCYYIETQAPDAINFSYHVKIISLTYTIKRYPSPHFSIFCFKTNSTPCSSYEVTIQMRAVRQTKPPKKTQQNPRSLITIKKTICSMARGVEHRSKTSIPSPTMVSSPYTSEIFSKTFIKK